MTLNNAYPLIIPVITDGNQFKTDWKPRILFSNTVDVSMLYGVDSSFNNTTITKFNTFSNVNDNHKDSSTLNLLFNAKDTYSDNILESNNTIFNKNYITEVTDLLNDSAQLITAKIKLTPWDIYNIRFNDIIELNIPEYEGTYRINAIKNYKPNELCDVELIKINYNVYSYDVSIATTIITRTQLSTTENINTGTGSSSSSGGSGGGTGGTSTPYDDSVLYDYIDSSFGLRDTSIAWLKTNKLDYRTFGTAANNDTEDFAAVGNTGTADLNTIITSGMYRINTVNANMPTGCEYGQLLVMHGPGDTITQLATDYISNQIHWRSASGIGSTPTWGFWQRLWHSGDFAPTDFVAVTGDTMTGDLTLNAALKITGDASITGSINMKDGGSLWIGNQTMLDSSSRLRLHHSPTGSAYIDYYENLYFRSGYAGTSAVMVCSSLGSLSSGSYISGFAGSGWNINNTGTSYDLEVDNLKVRNKLSAFQLEINEINSIGGGLIISTANGIAYDVADRGDGTWNIFFDEGISGTNPIQFVASDYIKAQIWGNGGTQNYLGQVLYVAHSATLGSAYVQVTPLTGTPWKGMKLVQYGNSGDAARQSAIYLTATDTNNPYIDFLSGVNAGSFAGKQISRIGNLSGITDSDLGGSLTGNGAYLSNLYAKGRIVLPNAGMTNEGSSSSDIRLYAGSSYASRATAPFRVTQGGDAVMSGVVELGTASATTGTNTGSLKIKGAGITIPSQDNDTAAIVFNFVGYNDATSRFRDILIYNGKGAIIAGFQGSSNAVLVYNTLSVSGITTLTGLTKTSGGVHIGGTTDPGSDNLIVDGTTTLTGAITLTGLTKTTGGVHIGGTTDPGVDNLIVDGTTTHTGITTQTGTLDINGNIDATGSSNIALSQRHLGAQGGTDITCATSNTIISDMTLGITPKGSHILVMFSAPFYTSTAGVVHLNIQTVQGGYGSTSDTTVSQVTNAPGVITFNTLVDVTPNVYTAVYIYWYGANTNIKQRGSTDGVRKVIAIDLM